MKNYRIRWKNEKLNETAEITVRGVLDGRNFITSKAKALEILVKLLYWNMNSMQCGWGDSYPYAIVDGMEVRLDCFVVREIMNMGIDPRPYFFCDIMTSDNRDVEFGKFV